MGIDLLIFRWINGFGTKSDLIDLAAWVLTDYDRLIFAGLFSYYLLFHRREPVRMRIVIVLSVVAGLITLAVANEMGMMFYRPRPFRSFEEAQLLLPQSSDSSFVSEYAAVCMAFAAGMWRGPGRSARWVFGLLAVLVGVSQVFVGFHWPSDILASAVLGILVARAVFRGFTRAWPLLRSVELPPGGL